MTPWYLQKPEASIIRWGFDWVGKKRGNETGGELLSAEEEVSMVSKLEVSMFGLSLPRSHVQLASPYCIVGIPPQQG